MGKTCAFSGHRPGKLPWGSNEQDPRCVALRIKMEQELRRICEAGTDRFLCGMARGTDLMFGELVVKLRGAYPITLEGALPCPGQETRWPQKEQARFQALLGQCDSVTCLEQNYSEGCMLRRNRYMVDNAQLLLTVWDGNPHSGTGATVTYGRQRGLTIIPLWR